jgi:hypothetical protein
MERSPLGGRNLGRTSGLLGAGRTVSLIPCLSGRVVQTRLVESCIAL